MKNIPFKWFTVIPIVIINSTSGQNSFFSSLDTTLHKYVNNEFHEYIQNTNEDIISKMQIKVYTGKSFETVIINNVPMIKPDVIYQYIDQLKPLVIYVHGFREVPANESIHTIIAAHLERGTDNIFLLDWSQLAWDNYITVISKIKYIASIFANTIDTLIDLGENIEDIHLVGHSLGAQICGLAGKYSKYILPRITGLDPAGPGFYQFGAEHIDNHSAEFVDIIHTDSGFYGALALTGTVDIFPNGGTRPQPGCAFIGILLSPTDLCSHWRSWRFYAESVKNIDAFIAVRCKNYGDYKRGYCQNNRVIYVGYNIPTDVSGTFYLSTNNESPYGNNLN